MRGLPSLTAWMVSAARAVSTRPGTAGEPLDPIAADLLPAGVGALAARLGDRSRKSARFERALGVASLGLTDHLRLRTLAIDAIVRRVEAPQLVILGAGADARAYRMPELRGVAVYEVDHPATQAEKRRRLGARAGETRFVAVDFERDALGDELARAGHEPARVTLFVWEGVTPYLTPAAVTATLGAIAARAAPESRVALTYGTPELAGFGRALHPLVRPAFAVLGEPLRGLMRPYDAARTVGDAGFSVEGDTSSTEWAEGANVPPPRFAIAERLLEARVLGRRA